MFTRIKIEYKIIQGHCRTWSSLYFRPFPSFSRKTIVQLYFSIIYWHKRWLGSSLDRALPQEIFTQHVDVICNSLDDLLLIRPMKKKKYWLLRVCLIRVGSPLDGWSSKSGHDWNHKSDEIMAGFGRRFCLALDCYVIYKPSDTKLFHTFLNCFWLRGNDVKN